MTELKKLILPTAVFLLGTGAVVSANINYYQNKEIDELRSRIDIMEAYFPVEIPDRSWK